MVAPLACNEWDPMSSSTKPEVLTPANGTTFLTALMMFLPQMNCQELAGTYFHGTYNILPADKLPGTWKDILESTKKCFRFGLIMHQVNHPHNKGLDWTTQVCFIIQSMVENSVSLPTIFWLSMVSDTVFMQASNWLAKCGAISCLSANNFTSCNGKIYVGCCPMANVYSPTRSKK